MLPQAQRLAFACSPWLLAALLCTGCATATDTPAETAPARPRTERPVAFDFGTTDGRRFSHRDARGRVTAILFVTTYDTPSQLQARRLDGIVRRLGGRINAAAVVLEPPKYAVLADVFRSTLELSYPVAVSGGSVEQPAGGFGRIDRVPTLVLLDRDGREVFRFSGLISPRDIEREIVAAGR